MISSLSGAVPAKASDLGTPKRSKVKVAKAAGKLGISLQIRDKLRDGKDLHTRSVPR